jgi:hypothetical protein
MGQAVAEPADEEQGRYFQGGSDTEGDPGPHNIEPQGLGDVDVMIVIAVALVACNRMNAAMISTTPSRPTGSDSSGVAGAEAVWAPLAAAARAAALRWLIMIAVVAMLRTATAAMASKMTRLPNQPMLVVVVGQPGWLVGRSMTSFRVIRRGRVTANAITSATSSEVMASCS